jgi:hypothetical protein
MDLNDVDTFRHAIAETPHLWRCVDVRSMVILKDGQWHNLATRFYLTSDTPETVERPRDFPRLPGFAVQQEVFPFKDLDRLITSVSLGTLTIQGTEVIFRQSKDASPELSQPYQRGHARIGGNIEEVTGTRYRHGHLLALFGDHASMFYRSFPREETGLDTALRGLPDPWNGVSAVLQHALHERQALRSHDLTRVHFVAPLRARIDTTNCTLIDGTLSYAAQAGSKDTGRQSVLVVTGTDSDRCRLAHRIHLDHRRWVKEPGGFRMVGRLRIPTATKLLLTLQIATFEVSVTEVDAVSRQTPLMLAAYNALISNPKDFEQILLHPTPTEARTYEEMFARLLMYCGFPTHYIGDGPDKEAPDVLAQVPGTNGVLVCEVTTGPLNQKGKLARLKGRADEVAAAIAPHGTAVPIIVTANRRSGVAQNDLDAARADNIRVLTRDDIAMLLDLAWRRTPVRVIASWLVPDLLPPRIGALWHLQALPNALLTEDSD